MTRRALPVLAGLSFAVAAAVFVVINDTAGVPATYVQRPADIALAAALAAFLVVGGLLGPGHPIGRLLLLEGVVWELGLACAGYVNHAVYTAPGSLPAPAVADWILGWIWVPGVIGLPLILVVFPDGRPHWRPIAYLALAAGAALLTVPALGAVLTALAIAGGLASLVARHRRAEALERARLRWFACAAALIALALAAAAVLDSAYLNVFPLTAMPLAIGVAVWRDGLYELETLLDRTLLAAALAAFVTVVFFGVIVAAGIVVGGPVATAIVAIAVQPLRARVQGLTAKVARSEPELAIKTLGGFEVVRQGTPVEFKSKKSRTLLKILIARRGRPVPRERLMELLWPGEDPAKLGNRLSVALTTLRATLGRELDVIKTDAGAVSLDLTLVGVDVERFLRAPAERLYTGDFLEEDAYEDWATDLRDEARAAYAALLRARAADPKETIRACLRLLELDPYDAGAHEALIARLDGTGRHGEAIERRRTYIRTMHEIGVQAAL